MGCFSCWWFSWLWSCCSWCLVCRFCYCWGRCIFLVLYFSFFVGFLVGGCFSVGWLYWWMFGYSWWSCGSWLLLLCSFGLCRFVGFSDSFSYCWSCFVGCCGLGMLLGRICFFGSCVVWLCSCVWCCCFSFWIWIVCSCWRICFLVFCLWLGLVCVVCWWFCLWLVVG